MIVKDEQRQAERFKLFTKDIIWAPEKPEDI